MKLLLLDLDGTVREPRSIAKFIDNPWDQNLIDGVKQRLEEAAVGGWTIVGITNQGGAPHDHKSLADEIEEQKYTLSLATQIGQIFFCPDNGFTCLVVLRDSVDKITDATSPFRKPSPGMIDYALMLFFGRRQLFAGEEILMIGDSPEDDAAAFAAKVPFMWAKNWRENGLPQQLAVSDQGLDPIAATPQQERSSEAQPKKTVKSKKDPLYFEILVWLFYAWFISFALTSILDRFQDPDFWHSPVQIFGAFFQAVGIYGLTVFLNMTRRIKELWNRF